MFPVRNMFHVSNVTNVSSTNQQLSKLFKRSHHCRAQDRLKTRHSYLHRYGDSSSTSALHLDPVRVGLATTATMRSSSLCTRIGEAWAPDPYRRTIAMRFHRRRLTSLRRCGRSTNRKTTIRTTISCMQIPRFYARSSPHGNGGSFHAHITNVHRC